MGTRVVREMINPEQEFCGFWGRFVNPQSSAIYSLKIRTTLRNEFVDPLMTYTTTSHLTGILDGCVKDGLNIIYNLLIGIYYRSRAVDRLFSQVVIKWTSDLNTNNFLSTFWSYRTHRGSDKNWSKTELWTWSAPSSSNLCGLCKPRDFEIILEACLCRPPVIVSLVY